MANALRQHRIVIVSGPPGAGKTTVGRPLAEALGFALLSKDDIKEALFAAMHDPAREAADDLDFSRRLSVAAMETLLALAPHCPDVVLEANFRPRSEQERGRLAALPGRIVEVYCRLPLEEAVRRFAERAERERHHPAHALKTMPLERMAEYDAPVGLGKVIEVDTSRALDVEALVERVREALKEQTAL
ncbi:AAA family ATPase [Paracidobacterium acidisoli]|uniref:AAA family ATPase n=1 Tax=Paracidobacterium acidisoli TaxID=2303751 RepID=A0A372IUR2_9BACT|nr:AAA family ATPase [Paracidobacterium acidisoli]MBT9329452.1 ATP-binding protein [Paracidobacterium acidisoli]